MAVAAKASKGPGTASEPSKVKWDTRLWKLRFFVSLICAIVLGVIPVRGILGFVIFALVQCIAGHMFLRYFEIPDYVIDPIGVYSEHIVMALTTFVVLWIVFYSAFNY